VILPFPRCKRSGLKLVGLQMPPRVLLPPPGKAALLPSAHCTHHLTLLPQRIGYTTAGPHAQTVSTQSHDDPTAVLTQTFRCLRSRLLLGTQTTLRCSAAAACSHHRQARPHCHHSCHWPVQQVQTCQLCWGAGCLPACPLLLQTCWCQNQGPPQHCHGQALRTASTAEEHTHNKLGIKVLVIG
jgi:hypothetical protein